MFQALINLLLSLAGASSGEDRKCTPCAPPKCSSVFVDGVEMNVDFSNGPMDVYLTNATHDIIVVKPKFYDFTTNKKVTKLKNIKWVPENVLRKFTKLNGQGDFLLATFSRIDSTINTPYPQIKYSCILGDPDATHDPGVLYKIPFAKGKKFKVSQGFNGSHSHKKKTRKHAIDIEMPIGTTICACRTGKVVDVVENFPDTSTTMAETNYIRILHSDGTYGIYAHLTQNGSDVDIGADVSEGSIIGKSGNSGESSAPHLHFAVAKSDGHVLATIPWKFKDSSGAEISWTVGQDLEHN